jgi:hypothetical protein
MLLRVNLSDHELEDWVDAHDRAGTTPFNDLRQEASHDAWGAFPIDTAAPLYSTGVLTGPLPQAASFLAAIKGSPRTMLRADDFAPGYFFTGDQSAIDSLNSVNEYRQMTPATIAAAGAFLRGMAAEIERLVGHPWRVLSVRQFYLLPGAMGGKHTDGWPRCLKKLFILPAGATLETGSTWFKQRNGDETILDHAGPLWAMFENSEVLHASVPPKAGGRPTIEIDLGPAVTTSPAIFDAGLNGWYPWFPSEELRHLRAVFERWVIRRSSSQ